LISSTKLAFFLITAKEEMFFFAKYPRVSPFIYVMDAKLCEYEVEMPKVLLFAVRFCGIKIFFD